MRLEVNKAGVNQLLTQAVKPNLLARAQRVQAVAGAGLDNPAGMLVVDASDSNRARYIILTTTAEAMNAEATSRKLTRAIDAARQ